MTEGIYKGGNVIMDCGVRLEKRGSGGQDWSG